MNWGGAQFITGRSARVILGQHSGWSWVALGVTSTRASAGRSTGARAGSGARVA
jgi:hypothetical protein